MGTKKRYQHPDIFEHGYGVEDRLFDADLDLFKLPLPLELPEPVYDWVKISIRCFPNRDVKILPFFIAEFGDPEPDYTETKGIFSYKFRDGICLSVDNYYFWYIIQFKAREKLFLKVQKIYDAVQSIYRSAEIKFSCAEIAFDLKFPGKTKDDVFEILRQINLISHPQKHIVPRRYIDGEEKDIDGDVTNGEITIYDNKKEKYYKPDSEKHSKRKISRKQKIYMKEINNVFTIRFEVTLKGESLERHASKNIPISKYVNNGPKQVKLTDFYNFGVYDYEAFKKVALEEAPQNNDKYGDCILRTLMYGRNITTTASKIHRAYRVMRYIDSRKLKDRHRSGEFYQLIKLFDE